MPRQAVPTEPTSSLKPIDLEVLLRALKSESNANLMRAFRDPQHYLWSSKTLTQANVDGLSQALCVGQFDVIEDASGRLIVNRPGTKLFLLLNFFLDDALSLVRRVVWMKQDRELLLAANPEFAESIKLIACQLRQDKLPEKLVPHKDNLQSLVDLFLTVTEQIALEAAERRAARKLRAPEQAESADLMEGPPARKRERQESQQDQMQSPQGEQEQSHPVMTPAVAGEVSIEPIVRIEHPDGLMSMQMRSFVPFDCQCGSGFYRVAVTAPLPASHTWEVTSNLPFFFSYDAVNGVHIAETQPMTAKPIVQREAGRYAVFALQAPQPADAYPASVADRFAQVPQSTMFQQGASAQIGSTQLPLPIISHVALLRGVSVFARGVVAQLPQVERYEQGANPAQQGGTSTRTPGC